MPVISTPSGSGLPPRSGDIIGAGSAQPPSDCELPPLPPSLCIPSLQFLHAGSGNRSHEGTSAADEAGDHRDPARAAKQHLGFAGLFIHLQIDPSRSIGDERPGEVGL